MTRYHMLLTLIAAIAAGASALLFVVLLDQRSGPPIVIENDLAQTEIVISIDGAVSRSGVYTLPGGSRLNDAVLAAGGLTEDADTAAVNLATRLDDEEKIVIPRLAQVGTSGSPVAIGIRAQVTPESRAIDINTADAATLETLDGIGPVLAARIVEYRDAHGPFATIDELARVDGVSTKMVDDLRDAITVGP